MKKSLAFLLFFTLLFTASCNDDDTTTAVAQLGCDAVAEVISETEFNAVVTNSYSITDVVLTSDCLEITIAASGCDAENWDMNLFSTDAFYSVYPLQRAVKVELINTDVCLAVFKKTVSFDLTPFQIAGQNQIPLNIEGWSEQIIYNY